MAIAPITGMLRRQLILDLGVGLGSGFIMANWYWYGYHMPRTNGRDAYYAKKEADRAASLSQSQ
ncbi:hypothetical protein V8C35DRAFT_306198 [Trichoderma chlorosporum]